MPPTKVSKDATSGALPPFTDRRPHTPFPRDKGLPPDEDESVSIGRDLVHHHLSESAGPPPSNSGIAVTVSLSPPEQKGKTIFLEDRTVVRKSLTKGGCFDSPVFAPLVSSTSDEYSYPDPFVLKAALQTLRNLNPGHRSVDGRESSRARSQTGPSAGAIASRRSSLASLGSRADIAGYVTDSSEREKQRQLDNATVIPTLSSGSRRQRRQPLHRELPGEKLPSAMKLTSRNISEGTESLEVMSRRDSHLTNRTKPLPQPPASRLEPHDGSPSAPTLPQPNRERSVIRPEIRRQGFSLYGIRQSLPGINVIKSVRVKNSARDRHASTSALQRGPLSARQSSEAFQAPDASVNQVRLPSPQVWRSDAQEREMRYTQTGPPAGHTQVSVAIPLLERSLPSSGRQQDDQGLLHPADNLSLYLKLATLPKWEKWIDPDAETTSRWYNRPNWGSGRARSVRQRGLGTSNPSSLGDGYLAMNAGPKDEERISGRKRTIDRLVHSVMQYEDRKLPPGNQSNNQGNPHGSFRGRYGRYLESWEARRRFLDAIENFYEKNLPHRSIPHADRWGKQIFALKADGFDTVAFHDEAAERAEDAGLLGWLTGSDFSFHVIPTSIAQRRTTGEQGHHHFERGGRSVRVPTELPDGCGSLVFVNNRTPSDRSLVFLIRPPWLIGTDELKDFVKAAPKWTPSSPAYLETREGQANLLQTQIYDECYANYCFFWCVSNLKHWVFGHFSPDFTRCASDRSMSDHAMMSSTREIPFRLKIAPPSIPLGTR
ncbi:hypothetical protein NliqN6_1084 [Naganishia liquefaciens]|uniref:Uncharacterized protein n=1 Tax=Naganishia liquefaciens TaxID=104408 RepID=A0A8H3TP82_9TREE|nr:hypothetical protein NliqN6_1084 [Naganishia liquefaciens]